jgi:hypothetical protein
MAHYPPFSQDQDHSTQAILLSPQTWTLVSVPIGAPLKVQEEQKQTRHSLRQQRPQVSS